MKFTWKAAIASRKRPGLPLVAGMFALVSAIALAVTSAQSAASRPPKVEAPELPRVEAGAGLAEGEILVGTRAGLLRFSTNSRSASPLWSGGEVKKILRPAAGPGWFILEAGGILFSSDLTTFAERNSGLPIKTYKRIEAGKKVFDREVTDLKDLECDATGTTLVTCTKDEVWISGDAGLSWSSLGSPTWTTGLKCVALAPFPGTGEPAVFASHPISGLYARKLAAKSPWLPVSKGLFTMSTMKSPDEIADLLWVEAPAAQLQAARTGVPKAQGTLWASNSFQGRISKEVAGSDGFTPVWDDGREFGTAESLSAMPDGSIRFVSDGAVLRLPADDRRAPSIDAEATALVRAAFAALPKAGLRSAAWNVGRSASSLSELWLLDPDPLADLRHEAADKNAIYLQAGYVINAANRARNFGIIKDKGLNAMVVDLKDDYGKLRFVPRDPLVKSLGRTVTTIDIEALAAEAKDQGVWLVARIPVFKDEALSNAAGQKYAVWDQVNKAPWQGWRTVKQDAPAVPAPATPFAAAPPPLSATFPAHASTAPATPSAPATLRVPYGERWVDPYSEDVWAYNVAIANEIIARGFDEVQFDYIRFPTDGENLADASFRWRDPGMDKESAIASFLSYARENIKAPIGIDIYGANGWYRSGARTGQDVELLARYVDVICPMFYPSHFEQGFLGQEPAIERPGRIYRLGSLRNARIARNRVIIRPYVQAFYLNVSYDRTYYGADYVMREVTGVMDGQNLGMTFWNNVDRYDEVPVFSRDLRGGVALKSPPPPAAKASSPASGKPADPERSPSPAASPPAEPPLTVLPAAADDLPIDESLLN